MIRRCLIVDTETTGLDPEKDAMIEIAVLLYSLESRTTLAQFSTLLNGDSNPMEKVNRIPVAALKETSAALQLILQEAAAYEIIRVFTAAADVIVAHNAEFDRSFVGKGQMGKMPWLCTQNDFAWPAASRESGSLIGLALDHGIGVSTAHRALADCQLIAALFDRMALYGRDLQEMFAHAMRPKANFQALVSFDDKELAKQAGFKWQSERKIWTRSMAIEDAATLPFKTRQV